MADGEPEQDAGKDQPSLELPSLGWRRRRRAQRNLEPLPTESLRPEPSAPAETRPLIEAPLVADVQEPVPGPDPAAVQEPVPEPDPAAEPRALRLRRVRGPGGMPVVLLTGLVVGLGIVGLTWASLRLCESVQGTSSCGGAGYGLLLAILVAMVLVGALLLRLARVPEPGSTSFLAVGLTSVLALLFLVDSLMDRPMVVVIPLISAATFGLAHWVTRTFA